MARTQSYSRTELSRAAAQVKRSIKNKWEKGEITKVNKTEVFDLIALKLNLKSARRLWSGDSKKYLDTWYENLIGEFKSDPTKNEQNGEQNQSTKSEQNIDPQAEVKRLNEIIKAHELANKKLLFINSILMEFTINKFGKMDELIELQKQIDSLSELYDMETEFPF